MSHHQHKNSTTVAATYIETFSRYFSEGLDIASFHQTQMDAQKKIEENHHLPWVIWAIFGFIEVFLILLLGFCMCLYLTQRRFFRQHAAAAASVHNYSLAAASGSLDAEDEDVHTPLM